MAGYSGTPLVRKLGVKSGFRVKTANAPAGYEDLLSPLPEDVEISTTRDGPVDLWHLFSTSRLELEGRLPVCLQEIVAGGTIWVSWPKKASGVRSEITEDTIREVALPLGLVDVKVCAVDETWSGLKLVVRKNKS